MWDGGKKKGGQTPPHADLSLKRAAEQAVARRKSPWLAAALRAEAEEGAPLRFLAGAPAVPGGPGTYGDGFAPPRPPD